ncbi:MAG: hypothetical protein C0600_04310, partial [Ignavibacteria bacterium]
MAKTRKSPAKSAPQSSNPKKSDPRKDSGAVKESTKRTGNPFALKIPKNNPFSPDELRDILKTMMVSRRLDQKMLTLLKQGKSFFHIGGAGHEAA